MTRKRGVDRVEAVARRHCEAGSFASVEWLVLRKDRRWLSGRAGMADPRNGVALPDRPIYRVYSMTKPVISAIAMMLLEEGRLRLYDPVAAYLPEFANPEVLHADGKTRPARRPMLIEHLMTHQSGLSYGFLPDCPVAELYRQTDLRHTQRPLADFVRMIAGFPLAFEPGAQWRYSVATDVLARVLEVICDRSIQEIVAERVTGPLQLADTGYFVPAGERNRLLPMFGQGNLDELQRYPEGPQVLTPADVADGYPADNPQFGRGGYGLFSTIADYCEIARFLATGTTGGGRRLLSRKAVELMWVNRIAADRMPLRVGLNPLPGYGFTLAGRILTDLGRSFCLASVGECGWAGAASTWFFIDPVEKLIGLTMSQYVGAKLSLADDMRNAIYSMLD